MTNKITVIGGSGFVGTNLCKQLSLKQQDFEIIDIKMSNQFPDKCKIGDVRDIDALRQTITGNVIVNLAAVHRDDLKDMGSIIWAETVNAIRRINPNTTLETLIPDFQGNTRNLDRIVEVAPEVVSHNVETVSRLTRKVRVQAKYKTSLDVLRYLKDQGINRTKSGIMLGLGEREEEVLETLNDLREAKVDVVTIGQYLQPSKKHLPVHSFVTPDQFKTYETYALDLGFRHVESGPLVRSSYKAHKHIA